MQVTVIYPSDFIGGKETIFTFESSADNLNAAVPETINALEDHSPGNMAETLRVRPITAGDLLLIGDQYFKVEILGYRPISLPFANSWRQRTLVERLIGSGEYARISGKIAGEHAYVH